MTDRELLELAAKAADYPIRGWSGNVLLLEYDVSKPAPQIYCPTPWSSLANDGDALRLAVETDQIVTINRVDGFVSVQCGYHGEITVIESFGDCMFAATRRAITRAAAHIQLNKEQDNG